ncbi:MAG: glutathione S-transferase [Ketobacteraceae bacterium]|nr:glutathione S-transferase [Ketobacteraceae bacterium]
MIVVHHLENSRSQRILWMLEELGVDYEVRQYQRDPKTNLAPASLENVHPLGKSPVITDGDDVIAESGNIIEYLAVKYGKDGWIPAADSPEYWDCKYWLHYGEGSLMPLLVMKLIFDKVKESPMPFFVKPVAKGISKKVMEAYIGPNLKKNMNFIEAHLANRDYFVGDGLTVADIQMCFPLESAQARYLRGKHYPNITAYVKRIQALPGYQRAREKGCV